MADANATVKNIYVNEYVKWREAGKDSAYAKKMAEKKVKDSGWYLKNGSWTNKKPSNSQETKSYKIRSDENKKLASIKVRPARMA